MYDASDHDLYIEPVGDRQLWSALRETTLAELESRILELDEHSASEDVLAWLDRMAAFAQAAKELRDAVYKVACAWIAANGNLRLNDDICFSLGHQRTVRCVDVRKTLHVALGAVGGDVDAVATLLSTNAFKHGACRGALPPADFEQLFVTEIRAKLIPGKPEPLRLIRVDQRYTGRR